MTANEIAEQVRAAMRADGIEVAESLNTDGELHRAKATGDKGGEKNVWYIIHADEHPRAVFGYNKRSINYRVVWAPEGEEKLTEAQRRKLTTQVAEAKRQRAKEESRRRESAARMAELDWSKAQPCESHPYLEKKGVQAHGLRLLADKLVVPVRDTESKLHSLQFIAADGTKRFLTNGAVEGHFHLIGIEPDGIKDNTIVCEGYATGATLHEATGLAVAVAFHAGNLLPVAKALRKAYRNVRLILAADNDQFTDGNPGLTKARESAAAIRKSVVVFPEFTATELTTGKPTDYNDLAALRGLEAVAAVLADALSTGRKATPAPPVARTWMPIAGGNLLLTDAGLKFHAADAEGEPMLICSPLRITAQTRNSEGGDWGRLLEWCDPDGQPHTWAMPVEMLAGDGMEARAELMRGGLSISPGKKARDILSIYLQVWPAPERALCVDRTGWHGKAFVLPRETLGGNGERVVFQSASTQGSAFRERGDLEEWIQRIGRPAQGNTRLMLVICAALAPPLLPHADLEGGGIHLVGPSSIGKTVALQVARSVFAAPEGLHRWRTTANGLEATAAAHNHLPLPMDEAGQAEAKETPEMAYAMANGTEKVRATRTGTARPRRTWALIFISSGEVTLADRAAEAGRRTHAGAEVRVLNIPAKVGQYGLFNSVPVEYGKSAAEFARILTEAAADCYGTAGPAFIKYLIEHYDDLRGMLRKAEMSFITGMVDKDADGQVHRAARRMSLFAAAGELAAAAGILPWPAGAATEAVQSCFRDWLTYRGGSGAAEEREALAQVRRVLEAGREARFALWSRVDDDRAPRTQDMYGFRRNDDSTSNETWFYISSERFKSDVAKGMDAGAVAKLLKVKGYLKHDEGRYTLKARLPGEISTERFYCVRAAILEGDGDD